MKYLGAIKTRIALCGAALRRVLLLADAKHIKRDVLVLADNFNSMRDNIRDLFEAFPNKDETFLTLRTSVLRAIDALPIANQTNKPRELTTCKDYKKWEDLDGWTCNEYAAYSECGGDLDWDYYYDIGIDAFYDAQNISALEACCACGGGDSDSVENENSNTPDCVDIAEDWKDSINWFDCYFFSQLQICGGQIEWRQGEWGNVSHATDDQGRTAFDALRMRRNRSDVDSDEFDRIKEIVSNAPTDGTRTVVTISHWSYGRRRSQ